MTWNCPLCEEPVKDSMFYHLNQSCEFNNKPVSEFRDLCNSYIEEHFKNDTYGSNTLWVNSLREFLNPFQIVQLIILQDEVCKYCWNADAGCQCWNDE